MAKTESAPEAVTADDIAAELTPLCQPCATYGSHQKTVLLGLCVAYFFCIIPVAISSALLPALEDDAGLDWTPLVSGVYVAMTTWAIALGSLTIGWLPDYFPNTLVILTFLFTSGVLLNGMSVAPTAVLFVAMHLAVFVGKSVTWPAAMSIIGTHLRGLRPELGILLVGLASRTSSFGASMVMGKLLFWTDWRGSLQLLGSILMLVAFAFRPLLNVMGLDGQAPQNGPSSSSASPTEASTHARVERPQFASREAFIKYCWELSNDSTFRLLICYGIGLEFTFVLPLFSSSFVHSVYRETVSESAWLSGVMSIGEALSVLLGACLVIGGIKRSTLLWFILAQLTTGIFIAGSIAFLSMPLNTFLVLNGLLGFTITLGGYIVIPLHCVELGKARGSGASDIACRITIIEGLAILVSACSRLFVGFERSVDEAAGFTTASVMAFLGTVTLAVSLLMLLRNPAEGFLPAD